MLCVCVRWRVEGFACRAVEGRLVVANVGPVSTGEVRFPRAGHLHAQFLFTIYVGIGFVAMPIDLIK